jgi:hypothetical protein
MFFPHAALCQKQAAIFLGGAIGVQATALRIALYSPISPGSADLETNGGADFTATDR